MHNFVSERILGAHLPAYQVIRKPIQKNARISLVRESHVIELVLISGGGEGKGCIVFDPLSQYLDRPQLVNKHSIRSKI